MSPKLVRVRSGDQHRAYWLLNTLRRLLVLLIFSPAALRALPITVDPAGASITSTWATEWATAGNAESWTATRATASVAGGYLQGTTSSTDSYVTRTSIASGPDLDLGYNDFIELRLQVPASYAGDIQIFYGTTSYKVQAANGSTTTAATGGFNAARAITIPAASIPKDGAFHVYRIDAGLEPLWRATLTDLRIDPVDGAGSSGMAFAIDYIRIGDEPGATVYQSRTTTACPVAGGTDPVNGQTVFSLESKHFRFSWTAAAEASPSWTSNTPHGTLRNLEESWQVYVRKFGFRETSQDTTTHGGTTYKTNLITWNSGYWCGIDSFNGTNLAYLNITPDGLAVDPPTTIIPHEFRHAIQFHNTSGYVPGDWWEFDANYGRERWFQHYQALYANTSGIDPTYLRCAHQILSEGRDYYLTWPLFLYLEENPDALPDLGEGTVKNIWQQTQSGEYSLMALERLTPTTSLKDIAGYFARRGATYNYSSKTAIQASLAKFGTPLENAATSRWQFTDLLQRSDDPTWWRVPFEMAPMQGAYAIHELAVPNSGTAGRVVSVNFHGLPDTARGADWRASFIIVADNGTERYSSLWGSGTNSVTLGATENKLYLSVAGAPAVFSATGQDESVYPYRADAGKARFPYEIQVTGASPKQRDNGATTGLVQHSNGGGYKASTATVASTAYLGPNARVLGTATVSGNARIEDYAVVQDTAQISGNAIVSGHAWVRSNAVVTDNAKVRDWALVEGGTLSLNARVIEHANIKGGVVTDFATAKGSAASLSGTLGGNAIIDGDYGDFFYGRDVANGVGFGHLPYVGVPDSYIRPLPTSLYAAYDFAAAHDSRALDGPGVTDARIIGSPTWTAADARRKGFLAFDGGNRCVALERSVADFRQWTFTAWIKPNGGSASQAALWIGTTSTQRLYFTPDDGSGHARFSIQAGGTEQLLVASSALTPGLWTHVAVTLNGTTGVLYLNGAAAATANLTLVPDQVLGANTATAPLHAYLARAEAELLPRFNGALDDVRFYCQALSAASVQALQPATTVSSAGTLYVDLRASDASAGASTWTNNGSLGSFTRTGTPAKVANVASTGIPGVQFNGTSQAYTGPNTPTDLDGASDRSIEVWAYNPALAEEETTVSWAHRGSDRQDMAFNFGSNSLWGAATHWGDDVGWGTPPTAAAWHHLAYTYASGVASVYIDGQLATAKTLAGALNTFAGEAINIACQRDTAGGTRSLFFSGYINTVRIHGGVLTPAQIAANASLGPAGSPAPATPTLGAVADQVLDNNTASSAITLTVGDAATPLDSLTISAVAANPTLLPSANFVIAGTGATRTLVITPAAGASGSTTVTLTVSNGAVTATRSFMVTVLTVAEAWRRANFGTTAATGSAADSADPDADGLSNLMERAFGSNPTQSSPDALPVIDGTAPLLSIIYYQAKAATDIVFTVQESPDLQAGSWVTAVGTRTILLDDGIRLKSRFTAPIATATKKFLRVQLQTP